MQYLYKFNIVNSERKAEGIISSAKTYAIEMKYISKHSYL